VLNCDDFTFKGRTPQELSRALDFYEMYNARVGPLAATFYADYIKAQERLNAQTHH
jgi:hypothetical protein